MVFLIILIAWLIPIIVFGIYAWFNMKSGESLEDFIFRKDLEVDFIFLWFPLFNLVVLIKIMFQWLWAYLLNLRKP